MKECLDPKTGKQVNRAFKGIWIPKSLYLDETLTSQEMIILAEIMSLDNGEGCFASNEYLAKFFGLSLSRIQNKLSELRKRGFIETIEFDGRTRKIRVIVPNSSKNRLTGKREQALPESGKSTLPKNVKNSERHYYIDNIDDNKEYNPPNPQGGNGLFENAETIKKRIENPEPIPDPFLEAGKSNGKKEKFDPLLEFTDNLDVYPTSQEIKSIHEWIEHRKQIKKPLTENAIIKQCKVLNENPKDITAIIDQSINSGWTGLFPIKKGNFQGNDYSYRKSLFKTVEAQKGEL